MWHCNSQVGKRTSSLSSVWVGQGGRRQEALDVDCHHRYKHTEKNIHTSVSPLSLSEVWWKELLFSLKNSLFVHSPFGASRVWFPLSHLFSCYLDRCCIYAFTWCSYDIYTYFLEIWRLKFTVKHVALVQTGYWSVTRTLLSTLAAGQGERVAGREVGFRVKVRKARKKKTIRLLTSVVETTKVRYTV